MVAPMSPFFICPITDMTSGLISHQIFGRCSIQVYLRPTTEHGVKLLSSFIDLTQGLFKHRILGRCAILIGDSHPTLVDSFIEYTLLQEMQMMDCLEAYGLDRGLVKCRCYIDDFKECQMMTKQFSRFMAMRKERDRQIHCGILTGDKKYVSPRIDSY